ncbi:MAG: C10 family peptidase [Bacteroidales bacterium]|nr:C10 family peptidase [Bacteroidales bacterium]
MKRYLLVLLVFVLGIGSLFAEGIDLSTAQKAACGFANNTMKAGLRADELELVATMSDYYVFNIGSDGFVIISADDRFRPVIGYSDEGSLDFDDLSPELAYYLDNLVQGRRVAIRAEIRQEESVREEWALLLAGESLPSRNGGRSFYLVQTKWNQGSPYNKFAPGGSYAGCVATAMSQVMNYWKYPTHGWGNHTYTHFTYGELSANFAQAIYNFDLMPLSIGIESPTENIDAVAWFMYHCGIAVNMDYSPSGSGAFSQDVPEAVMSYFGYTNRCRIRQRDSYSLEEFHAILKDQFDLGWPCYYSGTDTGGNGGHAFVCDGYDDNDLFHFNWGWGGSGDGYFAIDELNVSSYEFNSGQDVITNYVPAEVYENTFKSPGYFRAEPNGDADFSVTLSWTNPTESLSGHSIDSIDQIVVMRDNVVALVIDHPVPGETMTCVDVVGLPVMVDYSVYAVNAGYGGRRAYQKKINLGPTCSWTLKTRCSEEMGWGTGAVTIKNSSGLVVGSYSERGLESEQILDLPQGRLTFLWTPTPQLLEIGFDLVDPEGQTIFSFDGSSDQMLQGIFYEIVNTCGGEGSLEHPTDFLAQVEGEDVVLSWTGVRDPGYGYNIYRDGFFYTMVADTTGYVDVGSALEMHGYYVTAFCEEGETDPSNICCAVQETEGMCPRNFDFTMLDNGKVQLSWEAPENTENLSGYRIYSKAEGENYRLLKSLGASHTSFKPNTSLDEGNRYYFKIVSMYDSGHFESTPAHSLRNPDLLYLMVNNTHLPNGLTLQQEENAMSLHWDPAMLAESYRLYCNGELLADELTDTYCLDTVQHEETLLVYWVTGVVNGVESSPSNKVWFGNLALEEDALAGIKLFPNPTNGVLHLEAESLREVRVFNLSGQMVQRIQATGTVTCLDLSGLDSGVYYLQLNTIQGDKVRKVVLMK